MFIEIVDENSKFVLTIKIAKYEKKNLLFLREREGGNICDCE